MPILDPHGNPVPAHTELTRQHTKHSAQQPPHGSTQTSTPDGAASRGEGVPSNGASPAAPPAQTFELSAPTTARNAFRLLRALQLRKAVLVEGSPGVGKTALVGALASRAHVPLVGLLL